MVRDLCATMRTFEQAVVSQSPGLAHGWRDSTREKLCRDSRCDKCNQQVKLGNSRGPRIPAWLIGLLSSLGCWRHRCHNHCIGLRNSLANVLVQKCHWPASLIQQLQNGCKTNRSYQSTGLFPISFLLPWG